MKEGRNSYRDEDISGAVNRFKRSLISGSTKYFDVSEFEGIVEQLLEEGDLHKSEIAAQQGIQIHPNAVPLQLKYAQVLINKGNYEQSLQYLNLVEKIEKENPDVHLLKGSARMVMGDETTALRSFQKAIKLAGNEVDEILYQIATTYVQISNLNKALYYFEKSHEANPGNEMVLYDLGFFCDQLGKYDKSIKYYDKYLDIDPFSFSVWFNLGTVYNKSNQHEKAIEAYEFTLAIKDDFHMAHFNIGNALANLERYEDAILKYEEFLSKEPESDDALCYIGECYLNLENSEQAEKYYRLSADLNAENDSAWFGLGLIQWVIQEFDSSIMNVTKAIELDPDNSEYWLTLGKINRDADFMDNAIVAFKEAARIEPENPEIWTNWTDLYLDNNESRKSLRILKTSIKYNDDAVLKFKLCGMLLDTDESEALEWLQSALQQDFEKIDYLEENYPECMENEKVQLAIEEYKNQRNLD